VAGIFLVGKPQNLLTKAGPTAVPKDLRITNRTDSSVTISWMTDIPVTGFLKYSDNPAKINMPAGDSRDQIAGSANTYQTHYIEIKGLTADKTYYFMVGSGSATYENSGKPYQFRTTTAGGTQSEDVISGKVLNTAGQGVAGAILYIDLEGAETLSALSSAEGSWRLPISIARDKQGKVLKYDKTNAKLSIFVNGGSLGSATAISSTGKKPVPDIVLGKSYSFVDPQIPQGTTGEEGLSPLPTPAEGFGGISGKELLNPQFEGEKIATSSPEFRGEVKPGTKVTITINSIVPETAEIEADSEGKWSYTPKKELEPGEHTITIQYEGVSKAIQTIKRSFVVLAADEIGGLPAFTATPSGTPTGTLTPYPTGALTPTPTATISATPSISPSPSSTGSSMPATGSGLPDSGVLTTTLWLLIVGIGLFISGLVWRRKLEAYS